MHTANVGLVAIVNGEKIGGGGIGIDQDLETGDGPRAQVIAKGTQSAQQ